MTICCTLALFSLASANAARASGGGRGRLGGRIGIVTADRIADVTDNTVYAIHHAAARFLICRIRLGGLLCRLLRGLIARGFTVRIAAVIALRADASVHGRGHDP